MTPHTNLVRWLSPSLKDRIMSYPTVLRLYINTETLYVSESLSELVEDPNSAWTLLDYNAEFVTWLCGDLSRFVAVEISTKAGALPDFDCYLIRRESLDETIPDYSVFDSQNQAVPLKDLPTFCDAIMQNLFGELPARLYLRFAGDVSPV